MAQEPACSWDSGCRSFALMLLPSPSCPQCQLWFGCNQRHRGPGIWRAHRDHLSRLSPSALTAGSGPARNTSPSLAAFALTPSPGVHSDRNPSPVLRPTASAGARCWPFIGTMGAWCSSATFGEFGARNVRHTLGSSSSGEHVEGCSRWGLRLSRFSGSAVRLTLGFGANSLAGLVSQAISRRVPLPPQGAATHQDGRGDHVPMRLKGSINVVRSRWYPHCGLSDSSRSWVRPSFPSPAS
jgi:hypothetical protein